MFMSGSLLLVSWSAAVRGGLVAAVIWELGRQLTAILLVGQHYSTAYGVIGGFLAILLWGYYGVAVIFYGAEIAQVLNAGTASAEAATVRPARVSAPRQETSSWRSATGRACDLSFAALLLYVGLFLGLSHFRAQQVVVGPGQNPRTVVRFSDHPSLQRWARRTFAPLIGLLPGPYEYPESSSLDQPTVSVK